MAKRLDKRAKRRWSDLSTRQKRGVIAAGIVQNSLLIAALIDLRRRPASQINGDKRAWAAASLVSWIGPLSYFAFGRKR